MPEAEGNRRASSRGRVLVGIAGVIILMSSLLVRPAQSQLLDVPKTYAGDLWSRPRLTGDWFGVREELANRGVWLDVDWVQVLQPGLQLSKVDTAVIGGLRVYTRC